MSSNLSDGLSKMENKTLAILRNHSREREAAQQVAKIIFRLVGLSRLKFLSHSFRFSLCILQSYMENRVSVLKFSINLCHNEEWFVHQPGEMSGGKLKLMRPVVRKRGENCEGWEVADSPCAKRLRKFTSSRALLGRLKVNWFRFIEPSSRWNFYFRSRVRGSLFLPFFAWSCRPIWPNSFERERRHEAQKLFHLFRWIIN